MIKNHINISLCRNFKIDDVNVRINFMPSVIEVFGSNQEIAQINNFEVDKNLEIHKLNQHFINIFEIIKLRVVNLKTYIMFLDTISYQSKTLQWKSTFKKSLSFMQVDVKLLNQQHFNYALHKFQNVYETEDDMISALKKYYEENILGLSPSNKL